MTKEKSKELLPDVVDDVKNEVAVTESVESNEDYTADIKEPPTTYSSCEEGIDTVIKTMFMRYPFFGYIMVNIKRRFTDDDKFCPTACATMNKEIIINRKFWRSLSTLEKGAILEHEVLHLAFLHIPRFWPFLVEHNENSKLANIAMDCAINQLIQNLPKNTITLESLNEMVGYQLEAKQSAEYYYRRLLEKRDEAQKKLEDMMENDPDFKKMIEDIMNGHSQSAKSSANGQGGMDPVAESAMRRLLQGCKQKHQERERQAGNYVGDSIMKALPAYVNIDKNVWKHLINKLVGETPVPTKHMVYNKPNRRNPSSNWGYRRDLESSRVWVVIDTSASLSDDELSQFCGHISKAIKSEGIIVDLIQCDTDVQKVDFGVKRISKRGIDLKGRGGTDLTRAIDYIVKRTHGKKTRGIVLTDGYTGWKDSNIQWTAIYTKDYAPIPGMQYEAVLEG